MSTPTLPPLPDPWDYAYEWDGPFGSRKLSCAPHNGMRPDSSVPIFKGEALTAYATQHAAAIAAERDALRAEVEALREFFDADRAVDRVFDEVSPGLSHVPDGHSDRLAQAIDRRTKAVAAIDAATKGAQHG